MRAASVARGQARADAAPRIGIVSAFGAEADILVDQTDAKQSWMFNGNRFVTGRLCGNDVVIVLCGVSMVNAAMVTQLMLDRFCIERLVMSGIAGGVNPQRHVADVLVPDRWVMPMEVYWSRDDTIPAPCGIPGDLAPLGLKLAVGGDGRPLPNFWLNAMGERVATGMFMRENFVLNDKAAPAGEFRFDYPVDPLMLDLVRTLKPALLRSGPKDARQSVSTTPRLVTGGVGASGPAFLASPAYRDYLHATLEVEAMDMETAALAHVAYANSVPYIAFRSLSDVAGGGDSADVGAFFGSGLAEANASAVTLAFLAAWANQARGSSR